MSDGNGTIIGGSKPRAYVTVEFMPSGEVKVKADATLTDLIIAAFHITRTAQTMSAAAEQQAAIGQAEVASIAAKLAKERL